MAKGLRELEVEWCTFGALARPVKKLDGRLVGG